MIGIYKITNKINNKCYIGQSIHIERRWSEHCFPSKTSKISLAIQKYGKNNFNFEVIEECVITELDEKESYWIKFYNSLIPNGYNVNEDTSTTHTNYNYISKKQVLNIIQDLQNTNLTLSKIADKYNINVSNISRINKGQTHVQEGFDYPIRKTNYNSNKKYCIGCGKELSYGAQLRCNHCENKNRIEQNKKKKPVTREELKFLIRTLTFVDIGKQFNISDNGVRKWCKLFNLPSTKKEIKTYSDEEWKNI